MVTPGRRASAAALVCSLMLVACGDDGSASTSAEDAATTASEVCEVLRAWNNELGDSLNATSEAITDADDPTTANQVLLDGWDALIAIAETHVSEAGEIDLPATGARDELIAELSAGAEAALAVLRAERADIADLPTITVDEQRGALGGAFIALENVHSQVEPVIGAYEDERIRAAFTAEPGCEHVVQPF
jgi:hypothetical protein